MRSKVNVTTLTYKDTWDSYLENCSLGKLRAQADQAFHTPPGVRKFIIWHTEVNWMNINPGRNSQKQKVEALSIASSIVICTLQDIFLPFLASIKYWFLTEKNVKNQNTRKYVSGVNGLVFTKMTYVIITWFYLFPKVAKTALSDVFPHDMIHFKSIKTNLIESEQRSKLPQKAQRCQILDHILIGVNTSPDLQSPMHSMPSSVHFSAFRSYKWPILRRKAPAWSWAYSVSFLRLSIRLLHTDPAWPEIRRLTSIPCWWVIQVLPRS